MLSLMRDKMKTQHIFYVGDDTELNGTDLINNKTSHMPSTTLGYKSTSRRKKQINLCSDDVNEAVDTIDINIWNIKERMNDDGDHERNADEETVDVERKHSFAIETSCLFFGTKTKKTDTVSYNNIGKRRGRLKRHLILESLQTRRSTSEEIHTHECKHNDDKDTFKTNLATNDQSSDKATCSSAPCMQCDTILNQGKYYDEGSNGVVEILTNDIVEQEMVNYDIKVEDYKETNGNYYISNETIHKQTSEKHICNKTKVTDDGVIISDTKLEEEIISDKKVGEEIISNTKVEEEIISDKKVKKEIISDKKVDEEIISDTKVEEVIILDTKFEEGIISDANVEVGISAVTKVEEIISDTKVKEGNISDTKVEEGIISDTKVKEEIISDTKVEEGVILDTKVEEVIILDTKVEAVIIPDTKVEGNISDTTVEEEIISDTKIEEGIISDTQVEEGIISDTKSYRRNYFGHQS